VVAHGSFVARAFWAAVFENFEDGLTINEIVEMFDGLTQDQVKAVLDFVALSLSAPGHKF
jgi:uncharacterized protein (DUF433 family)